MVDYNKELIDFSSGKLSPRMRARMDLKDYQNGFELLKNFLPMPQGGMTRRSGTAHQATLFGSNTIGTGWSGSIGAASIPYIDRTGVELMLLIPYHPLGTSDNPILYNPNDGSITTVNEGRETSAAGFWAFDPTGFHYTQIGNQVFLTHNSGNMPPLYLYIDSQSGMILEALPGVPPTVVVAASLWQQHLQTPYKPANSNKEILLQPNITGGAAGTKIAAPLTGTLTSTNSAGTTIATFWDDKHVNTFFRVTHGTTEGVFYVTSIDASKQFANGYVVVAFSATTGSDNWREGAWSAGAGYPTACTSYNQRLILAGTKDQPTTTWASWLNAVTNFADEVLDQDFATSDASGMGFFGNTITDDFAFYFVPANTFGNKIQWVMGTNVLMVGTDRSELAVAPIEGIFSQGNINIDRIGTKGSNGAMPVIVSDIVFHASRDGRKVFALSYHAVNGKSSAVDVTAISDDLVDTEPDGSVISTNAPGRTKIMTIEYFHYDPIKSVIWVITSLGSVFAIAINPNTNAIGGFPLSFGGGLSTGDGFPVISGVCFLYDDENYGDSYFIVARDNDDGVTDSIFIDKMVQHYVNTELDNASTRDHDKPIFMDSSAQREVDNTARTCLAAGVSTANDTVVPSGEALIPFTEVTLDLVSGTLPNPLIDATNYWVRSVPEGIQLATSQANALAGTIIDITTTGSGSFTLTPVTITDSIYFGAFFHLMGETVDIIADGSYVGQKTVDSNGTIQLDAAAAKVVAGLPFEALAKTMPLEAGGAFGAARGAVNRIVFANLILDNTFDGEFGSDETELIPIELPSIPYSGDARLDFPSSPDRIAQVVIKSSKPLPLTILGMTLRGQAFDG